MSIQFKNRVEEYVLSTCRYCSNAPHIYQLDVWYKPQAPSSEIVLFGGRGNISERPTRWYVDLTCPETNHPFVQEVTIIPQKGEDIVGVQLLQHPGAAQHPTSTQHSPTTAQPSVAIQDLSQSTDPINELMNTELREWVKASAANIRDFCKTMITTATGAIPIFFAVQKYLGADKATTPLAAWLGIITSLLFIASAVFFILALRPQYKSVPLNEFISYRANRFKWMNRFVIIGISLFISGICLAIVVFVRTTIS